MTILDADAGYVVVINTFSVDPDKAEDLLKVLSETTEQTIGKLPGFVSANFHVAKDRKYVTNYAQWSSEAALDAMMSDPASQEQLKKVGAIANRADPILYELRKTYGPGE
ncbi:antibiotic biosynthesis monooxygenase family protein [Shinella zoogloeoides]|uniref:antibiotic biosynthesis monooxygenase family protein n=1 Tax=Shinella zoogloeoides TaxID=352475 RepID=UPI0028ACDAEB|nr:antibiotic biosynthesis monooxygenase family protein [Shinella zoogloeoides]